VTGRALVATPPPRDSGSLVGRLRDLVRPEFATDVIVPVSGDAILGMAVCSVPSCGRSSSQKGWCQAHYRRWHLDGRPERGAWAAGADPTAVGHRPLAPCRAPTCRFGQFRDRLCYAHAYAWRREGRPVLDDWLAALLPAGHVVDATVCAVAGCELLVEQGEPGLCRSHRTRWRTHGRPALEEFLFSCATYGEPRFGLRELTPQARLEIQYTLQCRTDERRARTAPRSIQPLLRYLAEHRTASLLDHSVGFWVAQVAPQRSGTTTIRAFIRYAIDCLLDLRDGDGWEGEYDADVWRLARLGLPVSRRARLDLRRIDPAWLREATKRWLRWRIMGGIALTQIRKDFTALTRLAQLTPGITATTSAAALDRVTLERYLARLSTVVTHPKSRSGDISAVATFLRAVHQHKWAPLPADAVIHTADHPRRDANPAPRALTEFVMAQLESPANLSKLTDPRMRLLTEVLTRTGLRIGDATRLAIDCLVRDPQHAPYLHYRNHKMRRDAMVPIDDQLTLMIEEQQRQVRAQHPLSSVLFPRNTANPDGRLPLPTATLHANLKRWLADCEVTDELGQPAHVTAHRFRHTYASRLINNEVSQEVVRRLLDHTSHTMTSHYARLADATIREQWQRAQKINVRGEPVDLPGDGPLADAAWMKHNLARAKLALPNGYCGLPLQKSCPHANACLTCPLFITTAEFLPQHHQQLADTRRLITQAETGGQDRMVQMNRTVETNLLTIIATLDGGPDCACQPTTSSCCQDKKPRDAC
jgi:site-specific recombinase XerD